MRPDPDPALPPKRRADRRLKGRPQLVEDSERCVASPVRYYITLYSGLHRIALPMEEG
ncbi:MAG: hypothetical protein ACE5HN_09815 [Nitrospiria bacterium]